jgi:putative oxidoreductase
MNDQSSTQKLMTPQAPRAVMLLRMAIGFVFVTEGIQKFLYPDAFGIGRFAKIGIPSPDMTAPFVGAVEIGCGLLVLFGLLTRLGAFALVVDMIVAIVTTKLPILFGYGFWGFAAPTARPGFWSMAHEARVDLVMLLGCAFLVAVGAGTMALDYRLSRPTPAPARR